VLDPFLGSGTTAIAAINTDRNFLGCEMEQEYFEKAKSRISRALHKEELGT
jgi:site-specific DNA-methyltransferase (adenine-specific)